MDLEKIKKTVKKELLKGEKEAERVIERTKEDLSIASWLKKAQSYEKKKKYKKAIDAYLKFLELKLESLKSRPETKLKEYLALVRYYVEIANCYEGIKHIDRKERVKDMMGAGEYYCKAADMYLELKNYKDAHKYYEIAGEKYESIKRYEKAAESHIKIAEMYLCLKDYLSTISAYVKAGEFYGEGKNYEKAVELYLKSAEINLKINNKLDASSDYRKVADCYRNLEKHDDAITYYTKSARLSSELGHYSDVVETYQSIAKDYEDTKNYETATYYYTTSASQAMNEDNKKSATNGFIGAGRCHKNLEKYPDAIENYNRAASILVELEEYLGAASCYKEIGDCYLEMNDQENAANSYFSYGETGFKDEKGGLRTISGYKKAGELYVKVAEQKLKGKDYENAINLYRKAASSYEGMKNLEASGDLYYKAAELETERGDDSVEDYKLAGEKYKEADKFGKAANSYRKMGDYESAVELYREYIKYSEERGDTFHAGEGSMKASECYLKLKDEKSRINAYTKAIKEYSMYIERAKRLGIEEGSEVGISYHRIGECYLMLEEIVNAKKYFENAVEYFKAKGDKRWSINSQAFLFMVEGQFALQEGEDTKATEHLSSAINNFDQSIKDGNWDEEYIKFLKDNKEKSLGMMSGIRERPEVTISSDHESCTFVETPVVINIALRNGGNTPVYNVGFLHHVPEELEVTLTPLPIQELKSKESKGEFMELLPKKAGEYWIKPVELFYKDEEGNKYMKATNPMSLRVVETPEIDREHYKEAIAVYMEYARIQEGNKNYFHAGEGYREIGEYYNFFISGADIKQYHFKSVDSFVKHIRADMEKYYNKAIESYQRYIEALGKELRLEQLYRKSDAYRNIARCYDRFTSLEKAGEFLGKARESYKEAKNKASEHEDSVRLDLEVLVTNALLDKINARKALEKKNTTEAREFLEKSLQKFQEAIEKGKWSKEREESLKKEQEEIKSLLENK